MSALTRVEKNARGEVLIPVNVEGITDNEGLSIKQTITLILLGLLLLVDIFWFKDKPIGKIFLAWVVNIGLYILIAQFFIRKFVLDEAYKMTQIELMDKYQNCTPELTWDVMAIDENTNVMQFTDGRVAMLLGIEQATIVGRPADFKDTHYDGISDFTRILDEQGMRWVHLNIMMSAKYDKRLSVLGKYISACDMPSITRMTTEHLGYLRNIEINTLYETEYYMVSTTAAIGAVRLQNAVQDAIDYLETAAYNSVKILGREEIEVLNAETNNVDYFDIEETMREMAKRASTIKQVFNIKDISFNVTLNPDMMIPNIEKNKAVSMDEGVMTVTLTPELRNNLILEMNKYDKKKRSVEEGTIEKFLIGNKEKIKNQEQKENKEQKTEDSDKPKKQLGKKPSGRTVVAGDVVDDYDEYMRTQSKEAREVLIALGEGDRIRKNEVEAIRKRTLAEQKAAAEQRAEQERLEREAHEAKLKEIEEAKEREKARNVNVTDLFD